MSPPSTNVNTTPCAPGPLSSETHGGAVLNTLTTELILLTVVCYILENPFLTTLIAISAYSYCFVYV